MTYLCFDFFKNLHGVNQAIKKGSGNFPCGNLDRMVDRPSEQISDLPGHGQCWLFYLRKEIEIFVPSHFSDFKGETLSKCNKLYKKEVRRLLSFQKAKIPF